MSEKAKQAAEEIIAYCEQFGRMNEFGRAKHVRCIAIKVDKATDAATAKLQDQLREFAGIAIKNGQEVVRLEGENADLREIIAKLESCERE